MTSQPLLCYESRLCGGRRWRFPSLYKQLWPAGPGGYVMGFVGAGFKPALTIYQVPPRHEYMPPLLVKEGENIEDNHELCKALLGKEG